MGCQGGIAPTIQGGGTYPVSRQCFTMLVLMALHSRWELGLTTLKPWRHDQRPSIFWLESVDGVGLVENINQVAESRQKSNMSTGPRELQHIPKLRP